jgi:hypothetical protein
MRARVLANVLYYSVGLPVTFFIGQWLCGKLHL